MLAQEFNKIEDEMAAAFNRRDIDTVLGFFDSDVVCFSSTTHKRISGLSNLKKTFEYYFQQGQQVHYSISNVQARVHGGAAIVTFHWVVKIPNAQEKQEIHGRGTHLFAQINSEWRIVHEHFSRAHHH